MGNEIKKMRTIKTVEGGMNRQWKGSKEKKRRGGSFCYWNLREWLKFVTRKQRKWKRKNTEKKKKKRKWMKYQSMFLCALPLPFAFFYVLYFHLHIHINLHAKGWHTPKPPIITAPIFILWSPWTSLFFFSL